MGKIVFIAGTDTGVGKTFVTEQLIKNLLELGVNLTAIKPIETGVLEGQEPKDGRKIFQALRDNVCANNVEATKSSPQVAQLQINDIVPWTFQAPAAPLVAAEFEGRVLKKRELVEKIQEAASASDICLVEGCGGFLVPLLEEDGKLCTFKDLAQELSMQVVLVVGSRLGALNLASLNFEVFKAYNIKFLGYIFNEIFPREAINQALNEDFFGENQLVAYDTNRLILQRIAASYAYQEICYIPHIKSESLSQKVGQVPQNTFTNIRALLESEIKKICRHLKQS